MYAIFGAISPKRELMDTEQLLHNKQERDCIEKAGKLQKLFGIGGNAKSGGAHWLSLHLNCVNLPRCSG